MFFFLVTRMNLMKLSTCSFNTFLQDRALDYLSTCIDQVHTFGDILQLVIVELIYKVRCQFIFKNEFLFNPQRPSIAE